MSAQHDGSSNGDTWERQAFAMSLAELEVHEAIQAIARLVDGRRVSEGTRRSLERSLRALRSEGARED